MASWLLLSPPTPESRVQSRFNPFVYTNFAAATPTSWKVCKQYFFTVFVSATKQAISITFAAMAGHVYVTVTLQMFIWLAQLVPLLLDLLVLLLPYK